MPHWVVPQPEIFALQSKKSFVTETCPVVAAYQVWPLEQGSCACVEIPRRTRLSRISQKRGEKPVKSVTLLRYSKTRKKMKVNVPFRQNIVLAPVSPPFVSYTARTIFFPSKTKQQHSTSADGRGTPPPPPPPNVFSLARVASNNKKEASFWGLLLTKILKKRSHLRETAEPDRSASDGLLVRAIPR